MSDSNAMVPNATWLFEGRDPTDREGVRPGKARNGEQWWTSLFALYLFEASRSEKERSLRVVRVEQGVAWPRRYKSLDHCIRWEKPLDRSDILVEANLRSTDGYRASGSGHVSMGELFLGHPLPEGFPGSFVPDVVVRQGNRVLFFENKSFAGGDARQLSSYQKACAELNASAHPWVADWHVLISHGNDHENLWKVIRDGCCEHASRVGPAKVILWEDILKGMSRIESIRRVLGGRLERYFCEFYRVHGLDE